MRAVSKGFSKNGPNTHNRQRDKNEPKNISRFEFIKIEDFFYVLLAFIPTRHNFVDIQYVSRIKGI